MRVSLFITCLVDQMFPDVGEAMVSTLRRLGVSVEFNEAQTCCGQVAFNTGYRPEARAMAEHFLKIFENDHADFLVAPSGSCSAMVRNFYGELFARPEDSEWQPMLDSLSKFSPDFMADRNQPPQQHRPELFE